MQSRHYRKPKNTATKLPNAAKAIIRISIVILIIIIVTLFCLSPGINEAITYQCKAIATKTVADEAISILKELKMSYEDLVHTVTDSEGKVTAVRINSSTANIIKSTMETRITAELMNFKRHTYKLPLGTVLGSDWLAGRGPSVSLKIAPVGYVKIDLVSEFKSAGINQTSHRIGLNITVDISAVIPLYSANITTTTNLIIAETIIVGNVPNYYSNIQSDNEKLGQNAQLDNATKLALP